MASLETLKTLGWNVSPEGYALITKDNTLKDARAITGNARDIDIKDFGSPTLSKDLGTTLVGPVVLQIQKMRNISAPKNKEKSSAPRILKLILSDGHSSCQAIEYESITELNLAKTYPGTKILIRDAEVAGSYVLLRNNNITILGGAVPALVERWQVAKSITKHVREGLDGPPPWVQFGQRVTQTVPTDRNFKSLETHEKEQTKDEFNMQREGAIAEAAQGAVRKTFGGGVKPLPSKENNRKEYNNMNNFSKKSNEDSRPPRGAKNERRKGREKEDTELQKPSGRVSLFAFLEDKLPLGVPEPEKPVEKPAAQYAAKDTKPSNRQARGTYADKYDASSRHKTYEKGNKNAYREKNEAQTEKSFQNYNEKNHRQQNFSEKAPRFQRQQINTQQYQEKANDMLYDNAMQSMIHKTANLSLHSTPFHDSNLIQNKQYKSNPSFYQNKLPSGFNSMNSPREQQMVPRTSSAPHRGNLNFSNNYSNTQNVSNTVARPGQYNAGEFSMRDDFGRSSAVKQPPYNNEAPPFIRDQQKFIPAEATKRIDFTDHITKSIVNEPSEWKWQVGDQCMAKYWEDNRYYNASITGVTTRTCMVRFNDYGNFEEVLKEDCIPVSAGNTSDNQSGGNQFSGSMVFRRGTNNGAGSQAKSFDRENNAVNGRDFRN